MTDRSVVGKLEKNYRKLVESVDLPENSVIKFIHRKFKGEMSNIALDVVDDMISHSSVPTEEIRTLSLLRKGTGKVAEKAIGYTIALIIEEPTKRVIGRGTAICSANDEWNPTIGKIRSLKRAIDTIGIVGSPLFKASTASSRVEKE